MRQHCHKKGGCISHETFSKDVHSAGRSSTSTVLSGHHYQPNMRRSATDRSDFTHQSVARMQSLSLARALRGMPATGEKRDFTGALARKKLHEVLWPAGCRQYIHTNERKSSTLSSEQTAPNWKTPRAADRKSTRLNSSHSGESRMPSSA